MALRHRPRANRSRSSRHSNPHFLRRRSRHTRSSRFETTVTRSHHQAVTSRRTMAHIIDNPAARSRLRPPFKHPSRAPTRAARPRPFNNSRPTTSDRRVSVPAQDPRHTDKPRMLRSATQAAIPFRRNRTRRARCNGTSTHQTAPTPETATPYQRHPWV